MVSVYFNAMDALTPNAHTVVVLAKSEALSLKHSYVGTEHYLLALLKNGKGLAATVLQSLGVIPHEMEAEIREMVGPEDGKVPKSPVFTPRAKKALAVATGISKKQGLKRTGTGHLLLALLHDTESLAFRVLSEAGITLERVKEEIEKEIGGAVPVTAKPSGNTGNMRGKALEAFGQDLTALAKKGGLDPVVGRENEIERAIQILCRRTKNNPVLIGEAGVGKTAVVEGLAQAIVDGRVPALLVGKRVVSLDFARMVAGTMYRGQFEDRLKAVMQEVKDNKNVIVFIDEMHTMVGAGSASGSMDASNILKPALSRGEIQCIGATTLGEYRKYIEKDGALERRFQPVTVEPPSVEQTIAILRGIRPKYEAHHKAKISDIALETAAKLSDRYISARFLPDKAIDIMDEAGSVARIAAMVRPADSKVIEAKIARLCKEKEEAVKAQEYEAASTLRDEILRAQADLEAIIAAWKSKGESEVLVGENEVLKVLAKWTGIPLAKMEEAESTKLLDMEKQIQSKVIGQDEAVSAVCRSIRRSRADIKDPRRPTGAFLFLGPTGVGKTYLARAVAESMFGNPDSMIQIDMSEYMEKFTASRLIGSPPGYIGYEEGGQLSEAVRRRPYSVVLFDEIEKAHPDVMHLLLQILEEGKITDSLGRKIDFRNTIIIMTSNVGAELIKKQTSLGFGAPKLDDNYDTMRDKILEETKRVFKPEFLNRLDDIIVFHTLTKPDLVKIVDLEMTKVIARIRTKDIHLTLDVQAQEFLIEKGYDPTYGARPMRRAVEKYLEDPMAEELLRGNIKPGSAVLVKRDGEKLSFSVEKSAPEPVVETSAG